MRLSVKAIITDLDNTLLHTDKSLSNRTVAALRKCKEQGIRVMIATARPLRTTQHLADQIGAEELVVSNGAKVIAGGNCIPCGIPQERSAALLNILSTHPAIRITLETGDHAYANKPIREYKTIQCGDLAEMARKEDTMKILVHLDSQEILEFVKESLPEDMYYSISGGYLIQIMDKGATKWNGIRKMLETVNLSPEEVVYFGDDYDDVQPLKCCGVGVAVSNGIPQAKAAADFVTDSNDADGVAQFIEERILK